MVLVYLYIIPTLILAVTFLIYRVTGTGFREFSARLESKVKTLERLSNMIFTKDMLSMFLKTSSISTQLFFTERELAVERGDVASNEAKPMMSMRDMRSLEASLKNALQPSRDLERVRNDSSLIRKLMIVYGILIALTEYVLVSSTLLSYSSSLTFQLDGIVFGVTIIFSAVLLLVLVDLFTTSRKINFAYDNVEYSSHSSKAQSADPKLDSHDPE